MADNVMRSYTASGNLYGAILDSNKQRQGGYLDLGDAWPFTMEVALEQKSRKTSRKGMRGQIIDSGARIDGVTGSVGIKNWVAKNIAMLVSGQAVKKTADSGSETDQQITLPADGSWVPLGQRNVSSVVIDTKVEGTDFEVMTETGLVRNLTDTEITGTASYSYAGLGGYSIDIATSAVIRMALMINGQNDETEEPMVIELDSVVFIPKSPLTFISEPETDYEEMEFDLVMETLPGKTSPGKIDGIAI